MAQLRSLIVDLQAQNAELRKGLDDSIARINAFSDKVDFAGKVFAGAFTADKLVDVGKKLAEFVHHGIEVADAMGKAAQAAGTSTEAFSRFNYAASLSDVSTQDLSGAFNKLNKAMGEAARGGKDQTALFSALGVGIKDASGNLRGADDVMLDVAEAFAGMADGAEKSALAMELFGKSGTAIIPFLNQGKAGLKELSDEADRFGVTVTPEAAKAAEQFNDNLTRLQKAGEGLSVALSAALSPAMAEFTDKVVAAVGAVAQGITQLDRLSASSKLVGGILKGFGAVSPTVAVVGQVAEVAGEALEKAANSSAKAGDAFTAFRLEMAKATVGSKEDAAKKALEELAAKRRAIDEEEKARKQADADRKERLKDYFDYYIDRTKQLEAMFDKANQSARDALDKFKGFTERDPTKNAPGMIHPGRTKEQIQAEIRAYEKLVQQVGNVNIALAEAGAAIYAGFQFLMGRLGSFGNVLGNAVDAGAQTFVSAMRAGADPVVASLAAVGTAAVNAFANVVTSTERWQRGVAAMDLVMQKAGEALAPLVDMIMPALFEVAKVLGTVILGLGVVIGNAMNGFEVLFEGFANWWNSLPWGDKSAAKFDEKGSVDVDAMIAAIGNLWSMTYETATRIVDDQMNQTTPAVDNYTDAVERSTTAVDQWTRSILNAPTGFKYERLRFNALTPLATSPFVPAPAATAGPLPFYGDSQNAARTLRPPPPPTIHVQVGAEDVAAIVTMEQEYSNYQATGRSYDPALRYVHG